MEFVAVRANAPPGPKLAAPPSVHSLVPSPPTRIAFTADVIDKDGKPATNLSLADFTLLEDGIALPVQSFERTEAPLNILLLFDHSQTWFEDSVAQNSSGFGVKEWNGLLQASSHFPVGRNSDWRG